MQAMFKIVEDPTTAGLLERLTAARLVHVVSHGAHRTDNPLLSRLTTDDGAVFLADVLGRRLDAELVVKGEVLLIGGRFRADDNNARFDEASQTPLVLEC